MSCSGDPEFSSGTPNIIPFLDSAGVLSESSASKNFSSPSVSSKMSKPNMHHRRTKSDVFCDVTFLPRHVLDSASIYSTENRAPHRSCDLSSQSSSTAASPPRSSCSFNLKNLAVVDKFAHLHDQVLSFVAKVSVSESGSLARTQVIQTIQDLVSRFNPDIIAEPFGSFCTGLSLTSSDVDIVLNRATDSSHKHLSFSQPCDSRPETHSQSRSSSPSSVQYISGSEFNSHDDQVCLPPLKDKLGLVVTDSSACESSTQLDWWEIPPPEPACEIPRVELCEISPPDLGWEYPPPESDIDDVEDSVSVASHEPVNCSSKCIPSDPPLHTCASFSFDDIPAMLKLSPRISNLRYIKTARIPIIKLLVSHDVPGVEPISVDITSAVKNHVADSSSKPAVVHSGICVREFVKLALRDYPSIKPLVMIMKVVLSKRGLSNPYRGGLGSYPLFIMVYYWTRFRSQSGESIKLGREGEDGALGRILMEFLKWAASMFPWETSVLDWAPAETQDGHFCPIATPRVDNADVDLTKPIFNAIVVIMDPLNPGSNVAAVSSQ
jgi:DNA polymerase sigma